MELVLFNKPKFPVYTVDELAESYGHKVIRSPPYHCHFKAIELIWARVKTVSYTHLDVYKRQV